MKALTGWAAGACLYAIALAAFAPARLLDTRLAAASDGRLRLAASEGTVWSGRATTELRDASGNTRWAAPVAWRLRPAALLAGRLDYRIESRAPASLSSISLSWSRIELAGLDIRLPATTLAAGFPALAPWGVAGELQLVSERLGLGPGYSAGSATLHWRSAGSALAPVSPLGDYVLHLQGQDHAWQARLTTATGPLQATGEGGWRAGEAPAFQARISVPPESRPVLAPFLRLVAVERGDGDFDWRLE